jgi:hypothetical protein
MTTEPAVARTVPWLVDARSGDDDLAGGSFLAARLRGQEIRGTLSLSGSIRCPAEEGLMTYAEQLAELSAADPALGAQVSGLRNLEGILKWAPAAGVPLSGIDLLQQDEYCYDLFVPLPDARWIVFGVT